MCVSRKISHKNFARQERLFCTILTRDIAFLALIRMRSQINFVHWCLKNNNIIWNVTRDVYQNIRIRLKTTIKGVRNIIIFVISRKQLLATNRFIDCAVLAWSQVSDNRDQVQYKECCPVDSPLVRDSQSLLVFLTPRVVSWSDIQYPDAWSFRKKKYCRGLSKFQNQDHFEGGTACSWFCFRFLWTYNRRKRDANNLCTSKATGPWLFSGQLNDILWYIAAAIKHYCDSWQFPWQDLWSKNLPFFSPFTLFVKEVYENVHAFFDFAAPPKTGLSVHCKYTSFLWKQEDEKIKRIKQEALKFYSSRKQSIRHEYLTC